MLLKCAVPLNGSMNLVLSAISGRFTAVPGKSASCQRSNSCQLTGMLWRFRMLQLSIVIDESLNVNCRDSQHKAVFPCLCGDVSW